VCLAYLENFASRSQAVVQRGGFHFLLSPAHSDSLFDLLRDGSAGRLGLLRLAAVAWPATFRTAPPPGAIYLNVGHTGLNETSLPDWVARHRLRAVYLIHDLIPVTHPQFCRAGEAAKHVRRLDNMLASATGIIGNSKATLAELEQFAQMRGRRLPATVAALIAGHQPPPAYAPASPGRPYFLVVGTIEARKNHMLLLEIWRQLVGQMGSTAPMLVIAGQRGWEVEPTLAVLDDLGALKGHVVEMSRCNDADLAGWIAGARALLMPSFVEGFGLPIIEALQLSVPVIASNLPVYRELAGEIPTYLEPQDEAGWLRAVTDYLHDGPERRRLIAAIRGYQAPNWQDHFRQIEQFLAQFK
jgi:glycosyltransferase involved in cell wall biosynthesis